MSKKLLEQIVKATVNWNGQEVQFDKKFLSYQDYFDLEIKNEGETITLKTKFKS